MLQAIRDSVKGWVAVVIVGLLIIPFAFWGVQSYIQAAIDRHVADVDGYEIDQQDFQRAYQNYRAYMRQVSDGSVSPSYFEQLVVKRQFLEGMINDQLLIARAEDAGYTVPDSVVAAQIRNSPGFQVGGVFSPQRYEQVLRVQRMSPSQYENRVRRAMLVREIPDAIRESGFVLESEVDELLALENQQRAFSYAVVEARRFDDVTVSQEEIESYYNEFDAEFQTPERVAIEYLELSAPDLMREVAIDEEALQSEYELQKDRYILPEERLASHILIEVAEDANEDTVAAARREAAELAEQARGGADFGELAAEHSDDPGAAEEGGSLGWIEPGATVAPVEEALFAMSEGEISDPVRSGFGFHVVWLREIRESRGKPFEEVRAELAREYRERTAEDIFFERSDRLFDITYENPGTLEPAADQLGLEIERTEPFTRDGGPGIATNPQVIETAFSEDVLVGGNNSELIDVGENHVVVVRVGEHEPASRRPLSEVAETIRARLELEKRSDLAAELAQEIVQEGVQGASPDELAARHDLDVEDAGLTGRNATEHDPSLLGQVFRLPAPGDRPSWHALPLSSGDHAVVMLRDVTPGAVAEVDADQRSRARQRLEQSWTGREAANFVDSLTAEAEIDVVEDRL